MRLVLGAATRCGAWLRSRWLDLGGVVLAAVYALPSLWYPFARDQPVHWYIGQRLLDGELPYVSGISTKPPGVFVVHAVASALFGQGMNAIRLMDLAFVIVAGVLVATFRQRRLGPEGGVFEHPGRQPGEVGAAVLATSILHYTFFDFSDTAHPELWQSVFMIAPFWLLVRVPGGKLGWKRALAAGVLAMVAVSFKHVAAITGALAGVVAVGMGLWTGGWRRAAGIAAAYTGGVTLILSSIILVFWAGGAAEELWEIMVDFILRYAKQGVAPRPGPPPWLRLEHGLLAVVVSLGTWTMGIGAAAALRHRSALRLGALIGLVLAATFATVVIQKRALHSATFSYYFVVTTPALALAMCWGLRALPSRGLGVRQLGVVAALGAAALWYAPNGTHVASWNYREEWVSWSEYLRGARTFREHHAAHRNSFLDDYVQLNDVARTINARARPGDTLCVDGTIMILYALTHLRCPSRFLSGDGADRTPEWASEYRRTLAWRPPTFFVTFGLRPRVRELTRRGYTRRDLRYENDAWYTVLEAPRDP